MQRLRFLLPLLILTLAVAGISYSVRSYRSSPDQVAMNTQTDNTGVETTVNGESNTEGDAGSLTPTSAPGFFARIFGRGGTSTTPTTNNTTAPSATPSPKPVEVAFNQSTVEVPINQERTVTVLLESNVEKPTAYTFNMRFDPKSVVIVKVEPGDIWERANILENKFNNNAGTLTFSAGQAFGTQKTNGGNLIKVTLMSKETAASGSELVIEDSSKFAYVGLDYAVPLKSKSIQIQVKK